MGETARVVAESHPRRMPYVPALDGLRGLAILAVLAYHHGYGWARGGFLGVSLFFTLSGFLIASLLLREHEATGRIDLRGFWTRRVRRLAPAGLVGIALALVTVVVAVPAAQRVSALIDVRAAVVQLANWRFVVADAPYLDVGTTPSPVLHYWSLAIEEQFYLVFPLLVLLCLRGGRRALVAVIGAVVVTSLVLQLALPPTDRVYFGTDTRAAELGLGVLLALGWDRVRDRLTPRAWDVLGVGALAATLAAWAIVPQSSEALLGGGLVLVGGVSVLVLAGALGGTSVPRFLSLAPLRQLGLISYGLYVVHFPLYLVLTPARTGLEGAGLFGLRVGASVLAALLLLVAVERPVRLGRPVLRWSLSGRRGAVTLAASLAVLALVTIPMAQVLRPPAIVATGLVPFSLGEIVLDLPPAAPSPPAEPGDPRLDDPDQPAEPTPAAPPGPTDTATPIPSDARDPVTRRPPRIVVVGDSTAEAIGGGLQEWATTTEALQVSVVSRPGCAVLFGEVARYRPGFEFRPTACELLFPTAAVEAATVDADAIVVFIGAPQLADWRFGINPVWRNITEDDIGDAYRAALADVLTSLTATGLPVLWADVPVPAWDLEVFGSMLGGTPLGTGPPVINDPARTGALNEYTNAILSAHPGATTMPFARGLAGPDGQIGPEDRIDGLHMSSEQVAVAANDGWLLRLLADANQQAWDERGLPAPDEVVWPGPAA